MPTCRPPARACEESALALDQEAAWNVRPVLPRLSPLPPSLLIILFVQSMPGVTTCLVTGNLEPIGWTKMMALGVIDLFSQPRIGGFGSDFCRLVGRRQVWYPLATRAL